MSDLIVVSFESEDDAAAALQALRDLQSAGGVDIADAAVIRKDPDGKTHVKGTLDGSAIAGAAIGGGLGLLLTVFFPVVGLTIGAIGGAVVGHAVSDRIDKDFVREVTDKLEGGHSALFVLLHGANDGRRPRLAPADGGRDGHPDDPGPRARRRSAQGDRLSRRAATRRRGEDRHRPARSRTKGSGAVPYAVVREMAQGAEAGGLDSVWVYDHLLFRFGDDPTTGLYECWTILSAIAEATRRVELGTIVLCTGVPQPGAAGQDGRHAR